jgi:hypothetical protein
MRTITVRSDREVDALVVEHVMRFRFWRERRGDYALAVFRRPDQREPWMESRDRDRVRERYTECSAAAAFAVGFYGDGPPRFSRDPTACAALKRKLREEGWAIELFIPSNQDRDDAWYCSVERMTPDGEVGGNGTGTEERALALAALRAYGIEVEHVREALGG